MIMNTKLLDEANKIYQESLLKNKDYLKYLTEERGITLESIKEFEIGFSDSFCLNSLKKRTSRRVEKIRTFK